MPGDDKPEQPLCRLRRRDRPARSSLAWSRAVPGDDKPEQPLCRLRRRDSQNPGSIGAPQLWQRGSIGGRGVGM
ncbi:hypothetical protein LBMAG47_22210 [Planctomycetia bacterium]|nr:hypothetical protein LBMAG47_22210 [Planctomycetia bacterium]